jgi:peptidoglycan/LPS O-acetylase OafA/YrhL
MYLNLSIFRFYLACSVVVYHLFNDIAPQAGTQAVFLFFLVSGFLVTKLVEETYKNRHQDFIVNRFLRIYPLYFFSLLIAFIVAFLLPEKSTLINKAMQVPSSIHLWFDNLFIFDLYGAKERLIPVAWSLNTELSFYVTLLLLSFMAMKVRLVLLIAFIPLPFIFVYLGERFYGHYFGSGIAFVLGALYFYYRKKIEVPLSIQFFALLLIPIIMYLIPYYAGFKGGNVKDYGWLLHIVILLVTLVAFELLLNQSENERFNTISSFLGALSYPIFLLHWPSSVLTLHLFSIEKNTFIHLVLAFLITLILSVIAYLLVERPIMVFRKKIRNRSAN